MTLASRAFAALLKVGPPLTTDIDTLRSVPVRGAGGAELLTDVYLARPRSPLPVILVRSPYGRRGLYGTVGRLFAERGYHAVIQSTRGTFGSGGRVDFDLEAADGRAAADWVTAQPWSDGTIGSYGASFLSFAQLALASTRPPQLKAMAIAIWGAERREYIYSGGTFALDRGLGWLSIMEHQEQPLAPLRARLRSGKPLAAAYRHLPLLDTDTVAVGHPVGWYRDLLIHDEPGDPYWTPTDFRPLLKDLGVPVTMLAGWYDMFLPQMLADYQLLREGGQQVRLRVGPWHHTSSELFQYEMADALDWFGTHLLGRAPRPQAQPAEKDRIRVEVMGGGGWRELPAWPPEATERRLHLQPGGGLAAGTPPDAEPDRYVYNPADPTPAVGGTSIENCGPEDNRTLEQRPDVLTYTTEPLSAALEVIGPVTADLFVASDAASTDFFARLCDVAPDGTSLNLTDGILRLGRPGPGPRRISVSLWPTAHRFAAGHRIRLQVSSGAHPRYARNPGTAEPLATATALRAQRQSVYHDQAHPSAVLLPVVTRGA